MSTASTCLSISEFPFSLQIKKGCAHLECELRYDEPYSNIDPGI